MKGVAVDVRTITLENKGENIKLSLWKQLAKNTAKAGDFLTATNLVVTEYQKEKQLSSTSRTEIQVMLTTSPLQGVIREGDPTPKSITKFVLEIL